jgi:diguanylate cyclase (GGDEF)-like protein
MYIESAFTLSVFCCLYKYIKTTKLQNDNLIDALTGMYNRKIMDKIHINDKDNRYTAISFDIDHFKNVNDTYGHHAGDVVLKSVAETIINNFKKNRDFCVRMGGEEFITFVSYSPNLTKEILFNKCEKIREAISNLKIISNGELITVTISIGVGYHEESKLLDERIKISDKNLYLAKTTGRNKVVINLKDNK